MFFNFNFDSTMDTSIDPHQFQKSPNPNPNPNPNFDRVAHATLCDQLEDTLYFKDVSDYLMLDENSEERDLSQNSSILKSVGNINNESSSSVPTVGNKKYRRIVKKYKKEKQEFRVAFKTKSMLEIMDDGFKWRKYGKKMVKSNPNPRNYFKCSNGRCSVKKMVERDGNDSSYVITTYEGKHNHATPTCVLYCTPHSIYL